MCRQWMIADSGPLLADRWMAREPVDLVVAEEPKQLSLWDTTIRSSGFLSCRILCRLLHQAASSYIARTQQD